MGKLLLLLPLFLLAAGVLLPVISFAEVIDSPRDQLESGVAPEDIACQEDRVLMFRSNNSPACVNEQSVDRLIQRGWELTTSSSSSSSELAPNTLGITLPIADRENFARLFANAADDEIVEPQDHGYKTLHGTISIADRIGIGPFVDVRYTIDRFITTESEQVEFMNNFMHRMGFENYDDSFPDKKVSKKYNHTVYALTHDFSRIEFNFENIEYPDSKFGITVGFDGWINDPDSFVFTLDRNTAQQLAHEFAATNEELNKSHEDGGNCEYENYVPFTENPPTFESVYYDKPFYLIETGICTYDPTNTGGAKIPIILVDGISGENMHLAFAGGLD